MRICLVTSIVVEHKTENKTEAWQHIPTGLLSIAAVLENKGHEVSVVDFNLLINSGEIVYDTDFYDNAAKYLKNYNAAVLGFSTVCDSYPHTVQIAQRYKELCKEIDKNAIIVLGGPQASAVDIETLSNFQFIDLIVRGEGELTFAEVIEKLETGETFADIRGITYREKRSTKIKRNPDRELIPDLDTLPIPAYHLYPITESGNSDELPLDIGRGCPYNCIYCSTAQFWKRKYRLKSIDRILKEIESVKAKYPVRVFSITHDLFTANKKRLVEFCNALIERGLDINWGCYGRIDIMDTVLLEKMAEAGCIRIFYGIESGSAKMQSYIGKNLDLSEVLTVIKDTIKNGITVETSFIIGFPEETEEDLRQTIDLFLDCFQSGVDIDQSSLFLLTPLPDTRAYLENKDNLIFYELTYFGGVRIGKDENLEIVRKYPGVFPSFYFIKPRYLDLKMLALVQDALNNFLWSLIAIKNELGDSLKIFKFEDWNSCTEEKSFYPYIMDLISEGKLETLYLKDLLEYENTSYLLAKEKFEGKPKPKEEFRFEFENKVEINGKAVIKEFDYDIKEVISSLKQKHSSMRIKIKKEPGIIMFYKKGYMSVKTSRINKFTKELIELCNKNRNYSVGDVVDEMVARSYNKEKCIDALKNLYEMGMIGLN
jgi:radical SAM superfamily enzyme YgiQ (UPF0313 family)